MATACEFDLALKLAVLLLCVLQILDDIRKVKGVQELALFRD